MKEKRFFRGWQKIAPMAIVVIGAFIFANMHLRDYGPFITRDVHVVYENPEEGDSGEYSVTFEYVASEPKRYSPSYRNESNQQWYDALRRWYYVYTFGVLISAGLLVLFCILELSKQHQFFRWGKALSMLGAALVVASEWLLWAGLVYLGDWDTSPQQAPFMAMTYIEQYFMPELAIITLGIHLFGIMVLGTSAYLEEILSFLKLRFSASNT